MVLRTKRNQQKETEVVTQSIGAVANEGDRVRINEGVPLRGAHECERTGVVIGLWGPDVVVKLDPTGKPGGPFRPGEYTVLS